MASTGGSERFETVIIGGGQAGLAIGYHLARRERSVVILDANERIGDSWRKRWDSLRVFTPARYDGLPGWSFPAPGWSYPTKDEVADYLESYAARFRLPVRTGIRVDGLSREDGGYVVTSGLSRYEADNVVVATGGYQAPRIPVFAAELDPSIVQLPFERVPKPIAAPRRRRPGGRRRQLGSRDRPRIVRRSPDVAVRQGYGSRAGPRRNACRIGCSHRRSGSCSHTC